MASQEGHAEVVRTLLSAGAQVDYLAKTDGHTSPRMIAGAAALGEAGRAGAEA